MSDSEASYARRSAGRRYGLVLRVSRQAWAGPITAPPDDQATTAETRAAVLELVDRLPGWERQVIACRYLLDLSAAETAEVLGIPAGTAKSRHALGWPGCGRWCGQ